MPGTERRVQPGVSGQQQVSLLVGIKVAYPEQVAGKQAELFREEAGLTGRGVGVELLVLETFVAHGQTVAATGVNL